jgi:hypothetical protein
LAISSRVKSPDFRAFLLPRGAPDPAAPPCMRQRFLPCTEGDLQGIPERVFAPHRGLESIGAKLRRCSLLMLMPRGCRIGEAWPQGGARSRWPRGMLFSRGETISMPIRFCRRWP